MKSVELWARDESRLVGDPEVADRIERICKYYTLLDVSKSIAAGG
jgi:hypothetical protein